MTLGCVVMASGEGRRFGGNKLLYPFKGRPMITHALAALPPTLETVVVARSTQVAALCSAMGYRTLRHALPDQSDTIRIGLEPLLHTDGCLFMVADQPLLTRASVQRLLDAFSPFAICRLASGDHMGNPVLFPHSAYPALMSLMCSQTGADVIRRRSWPVIAIEVDDPMELFDVDTKADLEELSIRGQ